MGRRKKLVHAFISDDEQARDFGALRAGVSACNALKRTSNLNP
jgi:hypothetical protein